MAEPGVLPAPSGRRQLLHRLRDAFVGHLMARLLALAVVQYLVWRFGASEGTDAVFLALSFLVFGADVSRLAIEAAIVPQLVRIRTQAPGQLPLVYPRLARQVTLVAAAIAALCAVGATAAAVALGVSLDESAAGRLLQLSPVVFLLPLVALDNALLVSAHRFLPSGMANAAGGAVILMVVMGLAPWLGLAAVPAGYLAGWIGQAILLRRIAQATLPAPDAVATPADVVPRLAGSLPVVVGSIVVSVNPVVDRLVADSLAGPGAVTIFELGARLFNMGTSLAIASIGSVLLAHWSAWGAEDGFDRALARLRRALRLLVPALVALGTVLFLVAPLLIRLLFGRGAFTAADVELAGRVLRVLSLALPPFLLTSLLSRFIYSAGGVRFAIWSSVTALAVNVPLDVVLVHRFGLIGIPVATVAVYCCTLVVAAGYILHMRRRAAVPQP